MTTLMIMLDDEEQVACDNCDWTGKCEDLLPITDAQNRLSAGSVVPAGECQMCGALAYCVEDASLSKACDDCQAVMDAAAGQISTGEWLDPVEMQAVAEQLAEYAMKARDAIRTARA